MSVVTPAVSPLSPVNVPQACDACGHSRLDDKNERENKTYALHRSTSHIADATWEVFVTDDQVLYFCNHHYQAYLPTFASNGYKVREWSGRVEVK